MNIPYDPISLTELVVIAALAMVLGIWIVFDAIRPNVHVGLSKHGDTKVSHGSVFVHGDTGISRLYFTLDKPEKLIYPSKSTLQVLFSQIEEMGFDPISIEIFYGENHTVYYKDNYDPVLVQPA